MTYFADADEAFNKFSQRMASLESDDDVTQERIDGLQADVAALMHRVDLLEHPPRMGVGVNWHALWKDQDNAMTRATVLDQLVQANVGWVRIDVAWSGCQPVKAGAWDETYMARLDTRIAEARQRGLKVLLMTYWAPFWATAAGTAATAAKNGQPKTPETYGVFLAELATRYQGRVEHFEMWNEPDLDTFWASKSPTDFARMVRAAYPIAKQRAPWATFILAAPTYLGLATKWFEQLFAAGVVGCYDVLALHPYMSPSDDPPQTDVATKRNWSIVGIRDVQTMQHANGDKSPIWVTEFGWSTHATAVDAKPYKKGVSEAAQATYTVDALRMLESLGIECAFVYTDTDTTSADVHEANFGLLRKDLTPKPVVGSLRAR